jgi:hypothetical protein
MALFEDERLYVLKCFTTESLYEMLDALLEDIDDTILNTMPLTTEEMDNIKQNQLRSSGQICIYLSELYRRNLLDSTINWYDPDCDLWNALFTIKKKIKNDYSVLKKVKHFMINSIEFAISNKIKHTIDTILETNRDISELQKYLTPEQYRIIRSGIIYQC